VLSTYRPCLATSTTWPGTRAGLRGVAELSRHLVNKALLVRLLTLRGCIGTQPQRDVGGLHGVPNQPYQIVAQGVEVRLVPEFGRVGFEGLSRIVLAAVEAPVDE
jgi:hypothetical protein